MVFFVCVAKAEQEVSEMSYTIEELNTRLDESEGLTGAQVCVAYTFFGDDLASYRNSLISCFYAGRVHSGSVTCRSVVSFVFPSVRLFV